MREILFRGFHPFEDGEEKVFINGEWIKGEWVKGDIWQTIFKGEIVSLSMAEQNPTATIINPIIPETVGQYTGLDDRNGKKIFEGDIIREYFENLKGEYSYNHFDYGRVFWYQQQSRFLRTSIMFLDDCPKITKQREYEVIGNIHSNPELLEQGGYQCD